MPFASQRVLLRLEERKALEHAVEDRPDSVPLVGWPHTGDADAAVVHEDEGQVAGKGRTIVSAGEVGESGGVSGDLQMGCLLYTSPSPRD